MNIILWRDYMKKFHGLVLFLIMTLTAIGAFAASNEATIEHVSGDINQTVTAGEAIVPIVYKYKTLETINLSQQPKGVTVTYNAETSTVTVSGTPDESLQDHEYNYKLVLTASADEKLVVNGTITVKHKPAVTTLEITENGTQDVTAGDDIKPIVLTFSNMQSEKFIDIPKTFSTKKDNDKKTLTISGTIPENNNDQVYTITIVAHGLDNDATVKVTINVHRKPLVTKLTLESGKTSQTVKAGETIEPVVFKFENATELEDVVGLPNGKFSLTPDNTKKTLTLSGTVGELTEAGQYTATIGVKGLDNDASATVTITVEQQPATVTLTSGKETQTVEIGESIEPLVFKYAYTKKVNVSGNIPDGVEVSSDKESKTVTLSGKINDKNIAGEYEISVNVEGVANTASAKAKIIVKAKEESSSSATSSSSVASSSSTQTTASSSSVASSSSNIAQPSSSSVTPSSDSRSSSSAKPNSSSVTPSSSSAKSSSSTQTTASSSSVASSSSSIAQPSSSSVTPSSDSRSSSSAKPNSSSVTPSSSSVKSSSSEKATSSSSSKSDKKSSSSKAKSSSSEKGSAIELVKGNTLNFSYANNELTVTLANASTVHVQIFDMMGHLLDTHELHSSASINLGHLPRGTMLVRIFNKSFAKTSRIVIK